MSNSLAYCFGSDKQTIKRDDSVYADGLLWRVDYVDGAQLGLSNENGHKELHRDVCELVGQNPFEDAPEI